MVKRWTTGLKLAIHDIIAGIIEAHYFFYSEQLISPVLNYLKRFRTFFSGKVRDRYHIKKHFLSSRDQTWLPSEHRWDFVLRMSKRNAIRSELAPTVEPSWNSELLKTSVLTLRQAAQGERLRLWNRCRFSARAESVEARPYLFQQLARECQR